MTIYFSRNFFFKDSNALILALTAFNLSSKSSQSGRATLETMCTKAKVLKESLCKLANSS